MTTTKAPRKKAAAKKAAAPVRRTQTQRREEAEQRLLDAALAIVAERGTVRMTLAEVAEAAGYSRGLPTHRFGNKAGLVQALATHIGSRFGEQRRLGPELEPGLDTILGNLHFYFTRRRGKSGQVDWTATRALLVMMTESTMAPSSRLHEVVVDYNRQALRWFEEHVRIGIERGQIAPGNDPATMAVVLLGSMRGVMLQWLVDDAIPLHAVRDRLLQIIESVLRPR